MKKIMRKITKKYLKKYMKIDLLALEDGSLFAQNDTLKWGSITYAQHGEDLMIVNIFNRLGIQKGTYWDIGAHHPYNISNTALLYKRGWRGINIEANPNLIEAFYEERPEDINLGIGLAEKEGTIPFYMIDEWSGRNSFDKKTVDKFIAENPDFSIREVKEVEVKPLKYIWEHYADKKWPDLMDFDVEGLEWDILKNCDFTEQGPKLVIIENPCKELVKKIEDWGYFLYCIMGPNSFFVRSEYKNKLYNRY